MENPILKQLEKKRDRERYAVIQKRWELEQLKAKIEQLKGSSKSSN